MTIDDSTNEHFVMIHVIMKELSILSVQRIASIYASYYVREQKKVVLRDLGDAANAVVALSNKSQCFAGCYTLCVLTLAIPKCLQNLHVYEECKDVYALKSIIQFAVIEMQCGRQKKT